MAKVLAITAISTIFFVSLLYVQVSGNFSKFEVADNGVAAEEEAITVSSVLRLKGLDSSEEQCEQMYGFLPCSKSLFGHLFLIVVYMCLLSIGETYLRKGGRRIFEILGTGFYGSSVFPVIVQLAESLILLVNGLFSSDEGAQENVLTALGLVTGSTIFYLTLVWGTCLYTSILVFDHKHDNKSSGDIEQQQEPESQSTGLLVSYNSNSDPGPAEVIQNKQVSLLTGYGVSSDAETSFTAKFMLLSLTPLIIMLLPKLFGVPYDSRLYNLDILITLVALVVTLLTYFIYQFSHSWLQDRRLDHLKDEHGESDEETILRLFQKLDIDSKEQLSVSKIIEVFSELKLWKSVLNKEPVEENDINELDHDEDVKISPTEFMDIVAQCIRVTTRAVNKPVKHSHNGREPVKHLDELTVSLVLEEKLKYVKARILEHVRQTEDGEPDESAIKKTVLRLFENFDVDKSKSLSQPELRALITENSSNKIQIASDEALVVNLFEDLDTDGNEEISVDEFLKGLKRWVKSDKVDRSLGARVKAIYQLLVGIALLAVIAEPLVHSVQNFSAAANLQSFGVAFIIMPLIVGGKTAIVTLRAAKGKTSEHTRLAFSEICHSVFMNNVLGFLVLLSVVYFRGLVWHASAEVMAIVIVGAVMGLVSTFMSRFPVWIILIAYTLYPLSICLVYVGDGHYWSP